MIYLYKYKYIKIKMTSFICIGDPHIQVENIPEFNLFMERLLKLILEKKPDFVVVLGDVLHTHERLHTMALNKAYEMINKLREITTTYVLVGNHDYIQNQQFLTENHWMSGMKEWKNTVIVDKVISLFVNEQKFIFCPYVPPGRFQEALNTLDSDWKDASCIFAHQEFEGCKMGAIISVEGDSWSLDYPEIVSGHIHSRQIPQKNIYYTGSAMQHAFGESEKNIIAYLKFNDSKSYDREEIDLELPRKKIVYMKVDDVDNYVIPETEDKIKVTLSGNYEEFKSFKKTDKYKKILDKGLKIVFKPKKIEKENEKKEIDKDGNSVKTIIEDTDFNKILKTIIMKEKNMKLLKTYELILNNKILNEEILFL